ncbi:hypothetical protein ED352_05410 [Muribaculaceae bacterium Isolate-002 (NCI)]|nr:hypothetical protein ED352_05410 [Muribaculaceae bacterium Isolate-002 (NCI)]
MDLTQDILFPHSPDASTLVLACRPQDYSASMIARAVEDCDAHVINLNLLADRTPAGELQVALRVDHRNASSVARSLRRFGYDVLEIVSPEEYDPDAELARSRANELLRYLEI